MATFSQEPKEVDEAIAQMKSLGFGGLARLNMRPILNHLFALGVMKGQKSRKKNPVLDQKSL
jgi:hypothetical protein